MLEQTYLKWLSKEVVAVKCALLVALEKRDSLLYIEEPNLKEEYMDKIGSFEEKVLSLELEVSLQKKKKQMIQTAINRRESIDLEAIEKQLEEERASQLNRLNQSYKAENGQKESLTEEEKDELKTLYKEIVRDFHPQVHNDITESQKKLFERALEAYKRQNLEGLRLIHGMLFSSEEDGTAIEISLSKISAEEMEVMEIEEVVESLMEDYSLAAELYPYFEALSEDAVLLNTKTQYEDKQAVVVTEIERILKRFPFSAKETLCNEDKLNEYLGSLDVRMNAANARMKELQDEIAVMIQGE